MDWTDPQVLPGLIGAVLSIPLAIIRGYEFWRDRSRIKVGAWVQPHQNDQTPGPFVILYAANNGRRPVTLVSAALLMSDGGGLGGGKNWLRPLGDERSPADTGSWQYLPAYLTEGQMCQLPIPLKVVEEFEREREAEVVAVYFRDQAKKEYRADFDLSKERSPSLQ